MQAVYSQLHAFNVQFRFLNGSNCDLRMIPNRACVERLCESTLKSRLWSIMISDQLPLSFEILLWIIFPVYFFYFLIVFYSIFKNFWGRKNGGSTDPVHILMTGSTEGVHVLYFPKFASFHHSVTSVCHEPFSSILHKLTTWRKFMIFITLYLFRSCDSESFTFVFLQM